MSISAYASLVANSGRFLDDKFAKWRVADFGLVLNEGAAFLQNEMKILKNRTSLSAVANQGTYTLADDVLEPVEVEFCSGGMWYKVEGKTLEQFRSNKTTVYGSRPYRYTFLDDERIVEFWPVPDTAAANTTLGADMTAAATSCTVAATTGFPDQGRAICGSEVFEWTAKTSTTLTGLTRGKEGTAAAAHSSAAAVTSRDVKVYGAKRIRFREMNRIYITGTVSVSNAATAVTGEGTTWTTNASAGDAFAATSVTTTSVAFATDVTKWYRIASVTDDTHLVLESPWAEAALVTATYTISSPSPFPVEYDIFLRAYALSRALDKVGDFDGAARQWAIVERFLSNARTRAIKSDTELYPHGRYDRGRVFDAMQGNHGSHYGGW